MVLLPLEPESSASAYSAISANIKFIGQPRPRDSCGYPKFSAWSADQIRLLRLCSVLAVSATGSAHRQTAYSAISANIKFIGQLRPRDFAVIRNFLRLGAPIKFRLLRLCSVRCICHRQRSQANCLFRHIRKY